VIPLKDAETLTVVWVSTTLLEMAKLAELAPGAMVIVVPFGNWAAALLSAN
jgi:hypothetical protein